MDDMTAFERQVAGEFVRRAGPVRPVDAAAIFTAITATRSRAWSLGSTVSATRLVAAGVIVALFGGLLLASVLPSSPDPSTTPAAAGAAQPTPGTDPDPSASPPASADAYEAVARLVVDPGRDPSGQQLALAEAALARYEALALSRPPAESVIDELGLNETPDELLERISTDSSAETLILTVSARDNDPTTARDISRAYGNEMVRRVRENLITDEVKAADNAIARNEASIRTLTNRLQFLQRKQNKDALERNEIIAITGQISALQRDIQALRPSSRAYVRNRLEWFERPAVPEQPVRRPAMDTPFREIVVATRPIPRGTSLEADMLTLRAVPSDATNEMALTEIEPALRRIALIDIVVDQAISPNMLAE